MWWIPFLKMSMTFIKEVKNQKPNPKQNHQISISRAKIRSTQSQTCVKYRGNIICIKRNTDVNTGDLKILHKKMPKKADFLDVIFNFSNFLMLMLDWRAMTVTVHLARWSTGHSFSVQCYDSFRHCLVCGSILVVCSSVLPRLYVRLYVLPNLYVCLHVNFLARTLYGSSSDSTTLSYTTDTILPGL